MTQRPLPLTHESQTRSQPEGAWQEGPFSGRQAIHLFIGFGPITHYEPISAEFFLYGFYRAPDPLVGCGKEPYQRHHEDGGIQMIATIELGKRPSPTVPPMRLIALAAHLLVNLPAQALPPLHRTVHPRALGRLDCPVEGHPSHDLRVSEMAPTPAHFPNTLIRFTPVPLQKVQQLLLDTPAPRIRFHPGTAGLLHGIHDLPVNVELELIRGGVPHPLSLIHISEPTRL